VGIAAPLTTLLLAGSDELSHIVSGASGNADGQFLAKASVGAGALSLVTHSPFIAFFVGLLAAAATLVLWCELLIRSAAVYVIVLMLPLFFAALVWPARRVWAVRAVELLVALILSKFAIVAVLALGGAAIGHAGNLDVTQMLAGATLVLLAAFSPWALLRLLPLHELAAGAAGGLRTQSQGYLSPEPAERATEAAPEQRMLSQPDPEAVPAEPVARAAVGRLDGPRERDRDDGAPEGAAEVQTEDSAGPGSAASPAEAAPVEAAPAAVPASAEPVASAASADTEPGPGAPPPSSGARPPAAQTTPPAKDEFVPGLPAELILAPGAEWQRGGVLGGGDGWRRGDVPGSGPGSGDDQPHGSHNGHSGGPPTPEPPDEHAPLPPAQEPDHGNL
jgi:hypothetical protein